MVTKHSWMKKGQLVRVNGFHWFGEIIDVAISDERIMLLIHSPKGIWRNHESEWLEFHPEQILPADIEVAVGSVDLYIERIEKMLDDAKALKENWRIKANGHN